MLFYHPLEHVAWVGYVAPKAVKDPNRWIAWSCRFWTAFLLTDLTCTHLKMLELGKRIRSGDDREAGRQNMVEMEQPYKKPQNKKELYKATIRALWQLRWNQVRSFCQLAPAIHWSLPNWSSDPWLEDPLLNGLMFSEAMVHAYQTVCEIIWQ
mmetsp:Transcript_7177/g.15579  ORF Transcript_7177/g.15579 Transcript_7177/m.15579 type:complete len:153 (+) Transcript_7177:814-1272(+)